MSTVLRIFWRDVRRLARNPVALVVTLGVAVIPALYAWFNVAASWDPYGNTSGIKVAVVNEDTGAENDLIGHLDAGSQVMDALHDNDQLGWTYDDASGSALTKEQAISGVQDGTYYAAIVIPADFSSDLASVSSGNFQKPSITYYVNEKRNTVVPEITDVGAETVEGQINEQFVSTVSSVVAEKMQALGEAVQGQAASAASGVSAKVRDAAAGLDGTKADLDSLGSTTDAARATVASAQTSLDGLLDTTQRAQGTLADATSLLGTTRSAATSLSGQLAGSLGQGASLLANVSGQANTAVGNLTGKVSQAKGSVDGALAGAQSVLDINKQVAADLRTQLEQLEGIPALQGSLGDLEVAVNEFDQKNAEQQALIDSLQAASDDIQAASDDLAGASGSIDGAIQQGVSTTSGVLSQLEQTTIPQLNSALDAFGGVSGSLQGTMGGLTPTIQQAKGVLTQLDGTLAQAQDASELVSRSLGEARDRLSQVATDVEALNDAASADDLLSLLNLDTEGIGDFMTSPVTLDTQVMYPVYKYGTSAAPFYTNLAIWVGGFVLIAIYKQEVDGEGIAGRIRPWQGYLGRGLLFFVIGQLQAIVVCAGDVLMGIQCADPVAFVFAGMVQSLVYVSIVFALAVAFKHIGKALAVVLVILQIPGSSGLYPIEMMPGFFRAIEPWLPFTYGIRAMREAVAGFYGNHYLVALLQLLVFLVPALAVGMGARRFLININALFDRRLAATELMVCEDHALDSGRYKLASLTKVLMDSGEYASAIARRAADFELRYPRRVRAGLALLVTVPVGLLVLLFLLESKLVVLILWVLSVVVLCAALIVLEYLHDSLARKSVLARMPKEQVRRLVAERLDQEILPSAPLESMRHAYLEDAEGPKGAGGGQGCPQPADDVKAQGGTTTSTDATPRPAGAPTEEPAAHEPQRDAGPGPSGTAQQVEAQQDGSEADSHPWDGYEGGLPALDGEPTRTGDHKHKKGKKDRKRKDKKGKRRKDDAPADRPKKDRP